MADIFDCRSLESTVAVITIQCSLFVITIACTACMLYNFNKLNTSRITNKIKYLVVAGEFLCLITLLAFATIIFFSQACFNFSDTLEQTRLGIIIGIITVFFYESELSFLFLIFAYRTYLAFRGSIFELSKQTVKILSILFSLMICIILFAIIIFPIKIEIALSTIGMLVLIWIVSMSYLLKQHVKYQIYIIFIKETMIKVY